MSQITDGFKVSALRNNVIIRSAKNHSTAENITYAAVIELAHLGFKINPEQLTGVSVKELNEIINNAREIIGADRDMKPVYPGFPKQVQELDTLTLLVEQILHYWSHGVLLPDYPDTVREGLPIEDMARNLREVKVLTASDAANHFVTSLTTAPVALSEDDKALLLGSINLLRPALDEVIAVLNKASNGENKQSLVASFKASNPSITANEIIKSVVPTADNADQVLRFVLALATAPVADDRLSSYQRAVYALSDKDAKSLKMLNLSRPARRIILERLAQTTQDFYADLLVKRVSLWRRVMRMIHPYSVSTEDNTATKRVADIIHSNVEYKTFNSLVEGYLADADVISAVSLLAEHQPGNLLRRLAALLRLVQTQEQAAALVDAVKANADSSAVSTLISAYNGVLVINDTHAKVTRVSGLKNTVVKSDKPTVNQKYVSEVSAAVLEALKKALAKKKAPESTVGVVGSNPVPLVRRDAAASDKVLDRGQSLQPAGDGETLRVFSHWVNNQDRSGYIDVGAVLLDADFETVSVCSWDTWTKSRHWATYSGDKNVSPGDSAAEYVDIDLKAVKRLYPQISWIAMTLHSWSGFPMKNVDMLAGLMLRSDADAGEVFEPGTVSTAFEPTTESLQSVPLAFNVKTGEMVWLDSSSGSSQRTAAASGDTAIGAVVYDEAVRPRLTMGELAALWADAHGVSTAGTEVDREALLALLD